MPPSVSPARSRAGAPRRRAPRSDPYARARVGVTRCGRGPAPAWARRDRRRASAGPPRTRIARSSCPAPMRPAAVEEQIAPLKPHPYDDAMTPDAGQGAEGGSHRHAMPRLPRRATPALPATPCRAGPGRALPCRAEPCRACPATPRLAEPSLALPRLPCRAAPSPAPPRPAQPCRAGPRHATPGLAAPLGVIATHPQQSGRTALP
jgi:hypothetical protein